MDPRTYRTDIEQCSQQELAEKFSVTRQVILACEQGAWGSLPEGYPISDDDYQSYRGELRLRNYATWAPRIQWRDVYRLGFKNFIMQIGGTTHASKVLCLRRQSIARYLSEGREAITVRAALSELLDEEKLGWAMNLRPDRKEI